MSRPSTMHRVATADSYSLDQDTTLSVVAPGVLGNDADVDGDSITASLVTTTGNGSLTLGSDGSFDYTPDPGFVGSDSFAIRRTTARSAATS